MNRCTWSWLAVGLLLLAEPALAIDAQEVQQLVQRLEDGDPAAREAAESALRQLGPDVLDLLPPIDARTPGELKVRLLRIRGVLQEQQASRSMEGSRVTLQGKLAVSEALAEMERQTGNIVVDYRARFGQVATDAEVDVDFADTPYWEALDQVLDQAGLTINNFVGDARKLAIVARGDGALPRYGRGAYSGLFRVEPINLTAERDLRDPTASTLRLGMEFIWEPRVLPVLIRQNLDDIQIETASGEPLSMTTASTIQLPVQPGVAAIDFRLPLELPPREVREIASLKGRFTALVPGVVETFEFDELVGARNVQQRRGGVTVALDRVRRNGGVQEISVRVRFDEPGESLQSHLDWVANNEAILLDAAGTAADEPSYEKYLERENEVGFRYLFPVLEELNGYKLIYKTPAGIAEVPVQYELRNIMLP